MLVDHLPLPTATTIADRGAHEAALALVIRRAAAIEPMGQAQVTVGMYGQLFHLEHHRAGAEAHAHFPVGAVGGLAFELQLFDGVEGEDVVGVRGGDTVKVAVADGLHPSVDQLADFGFGCAVHLWFLRFGHECLV
ncbi:hypothetical protein D3C76_1528730 [compost metagenome]